MAVGLKYSQQVSAYISPELKKRAMRLKKRNRQLSLSHLIEYSLERTVDEFERDSAPQALKRPDAMAG